MNKKLIIILSAVVLVFGLSAVLLFVPFFEVTREEPIVIACFSDPHHDYGLQDSEPYIRESSQKAADFVKEYTKGGADYVFIGGDITGRFSEWNDESIKNVMDASYNVFSQASKNGKALVVTGNHDPEPSTFSDTLEINSNDYSSYIKAAFGEPSAELYLHDLGEDYTFPFDEQLCYRYELDGFEFLCINTPNGDRRGTKQIGYSGLYIEQVEWVEEQLKSIGKEKTVFLVCHYSVEDIRTATSLTDLVDISPENPSRKKMTELMQEYTNVVYCYGHVHTEIYEVLDSSEESVKPIVSGVESSAIGCHMGSLGFYNDHYYGEKLGKEDPKVIQVMLIYVYSDRLVFEVHNTGEKPAYDGSYEIASFTIERDMTAQFKEKVSLFDKIVG